MNTPVKSPVKSPENVVRVARKLPSTTICSRTSRRLLKPNRNEAELREVQVAARAVEDVVVREVRAEFGVVLSGDCFVANANQTRGPNGCRR